MTIHSGNSVLNDAKLHQTLYHGTSSVHAESIKQHGLKPGKNGNVYLSIDPKLASQEAYNSTLGDHPGLGYKKPVGGNPILVHIDRNHPSVKGFRSDPEFKQSDDSRKSFLTKSHIHPDAVKKIEPVVFNRESPEGEF